MQGKVAGIHPKREGALRENSLKSSDKSVILKNRLFSLIKEIGIQ
jgi:hypothetical protein